MSESDQDMEPVMEETEMDQETVNKLLDEDEYRDNKEQTSGSETEAETSPDHVGELARRMTTVKVTFKKDKVAWEDKSWVENKARRQENMKAYLKSRELQVI